MALMATNPFQNITNLFKNTTPTQGVKNVIVSGATNPVTPGVGGVFTKWIPPVAGLIAGAGLASLLGGSSQTQDAATTTKATQQTEVNPVVNPNQKQLLDFLGQQRQTTTTTTTTSGDTITIPGSGNYVYGGGVMPNIYTTPMQTQQPTQTQPVNVFVPTTPSFPVETTTEQEQSSKTDQSGLILIGLAAAAAFLLGGGLKK